MNPTIRDVAKLANTSKSTVSRYLNGQKVKKDTEEALMKAIHELNFHPNINARRLVMNKTQVIGIIVDDITNIFYSGVIRGIEQIANMKGYNCVFFSRNSNAGSESSFLNLLYEGQLDGIILISFRQRSAEDLLDIKQAALPVVLVGDAGGEEGVYSVDVDNASGIAEVVHYLHRIGHRKIAYISGPDNATATPYRLSGYQQAIVKLGLAHRAEWIIASDWSNNGGYRAMQQLMAIGGFTAVVSSNDETAIGALRAAQEHGFTVPNDISIVGFDDIAVSSWVYPSLTTVKQPFMAMGTQAAEGLFEQIEQGKSAKGMRHLLKPELVIRSSCSKI